MSYLEPGNQAIPTEIPDGVVVWAEDGIVRMEEDPGGSPCSWPIEEDASGTRVHNIASGEDGTDVASLRSTGSPGSDLDPDEIEEAEVSGPIGPRMAEAREPGHDGHWHPAAHP